MKMPTLTLDHVDNIVIDLDAFPIKNLHALGYLPDGLHTLARNVREAEIQDGKSGWDFAMVTGQKGVNPKAS